LEKSYTWYVDRFHKYDLPREFAGKSLAMKEVHRERWYYSKFEVHNLQLSRPIHSEGMKEAHAERKAENMN